MHSIKEKLTTKNIKRLAILCTIGPIYLWMILFLVLPMLQIVITSVLTRGTYGQIVNELTLTNFIQSVDPMYLKVFLGSLGIAVLTTLLCLLIGYPFAYFVTKFPEKYRNKLMMLIILPFWTNSLIRVYAWIMILRKEGMMNHMLQAMGVIDEPLKLLYNLGAILIGMTYTLLPFMILPLYANIEKLDIALLEAARDLGANDRHVFLHITLPLTMPGVTAGSLLVFIPSLGYFFIPDLMGGGKYMIVGNLIKNQFLSARNWPLGSALSILLILLTLLLIIIYMKLLGGSKKDMGVM